MTSRLRDSPTDSALGSAKAATNRNWPTPCRRPARCRLAIELGSRQPRRRAASAKATARSRVTVRARSAAVRAREVAGQPSMRDHVLVVQRTGMDVQLTGSSAAGTTGSDGDVQPQQAVGPHGQPVQDRRRDVTEHRIRPEPRHGRGDQLTMSSQPRSACAGRVRAMTHADDLAAAKSASQQSERLNPPRTTARASRTSAIESPMWISQSPSGARGRSPRASICGNTVVRARAAEPPAAKRLHPHARAPFRCSRAGKHS